MTIRRTRKFAGIGSVLWARQCRLSARSKSGGRRHFRILAKETGRVDYFKDELTGRQRPDQVETVLTALKTVHALPNAGPAVHSGRSVMLRPPGGRR